MTKLSNKALEALLSSSNSKEIEKAFVLMSQNNVEPGNLKGLMSSNFVLCLKYGFSSIFKGISELNLFTSGIRELPEEIGELTELKILILRGNYLSTLPKSIGKLRKLEELNLINNNISHLPDEITKLHNLKKLDLTINKLEKIPDDIGHLLKLEYLDLDDNNISCIPSSIQNIKSLKELLLEGNPISETHKKELRELLPHTDVLF